MYHLVLKVAHNLMQSLLFILVTFLWAVVASLLIFILVKRTICYFSEIFNLIILFYPVLSGLYLWITSLVINHRG